MAILKIFGDGKFADAIPGKFSEPLQINFELMDGMLRPCEAWSFEGIPDFAESQRVDMPTSVCRSSVTWQVVSGTPTWLTCRLKGGACPSKTHGIQALAMGSLPGACSLGSLPASPAFGSARALWRDHEEDMRSTLLGCQCL